jgi:transcriptional regulator with PAS, ATPase and Fis domain
LNVVNIELPPLSKRREDIPLLIENFIGKFNLKKGKNIIGVSDTVMEFLMTYDFPGNVRELENIIEYAFVLCKDMIIKIKHLPRELTHDFQDREVTKRFTLAHPLKNAEADLIQKTLKKHQGNRIETAKELKINRSTLWRKIKKYDLQ